MQAEHVNDTKPQRRGLGLRPKILLRLALIGTALVAGVNTYNLLSTRQKRCQQALSSNATLARVIAGGLLGELANHDIHSHHIQTYVQNFVSASLAINTDDKTLALIGVFDPENQLVGGNAKPNLIVCTDGQTASDTANALTRIAQTDPKLGPALSIMRFPLKIDNRYVGKLVVVTSVADVEAQTQRELWLNGIVLTACLLALLLYGGWVLEGLILRPITQVVHAMARVRKGQLDTPLVFARDDEMAWLADNYNYMLQGLQERNALQDAFSRYVSKQIFDKLQRGNIAWTGELKTATVLFTDIRDFTTLSEALPPQDVVELLNGYFTQMVESIFAYDGFVNKFIGDALMAVYNAPLDQDFPELRAVCTAIEMRQKLIQLNQMRAAQGKEPIRIGMGINTGSVLAGNIGHKQRLEYTVIGDAVNVAQRLESQTKQAAVDLLISASTWQAVAPFVHGSPLGEVMLKGKTQPVQLYRVDGLNVGATWPKKIGTPSGA